MKTKQLYVCAECGTEYSKWQGRCNNCGAWNTLEEKQVMQAQMRATKEVFTQPVEVQRLGDVDVTSLKRVSTTFQEVDLVLNGGIVDSQVILLSGEPGIGKSTLLLQILVNQAKVGMKALYVSGEESIGQVTGRAARIYPQKEYDDVQFIMSPGVQSLINKVAEVKPGIVVIDSIQTMFDEGVAGLPGSLSQVKACTSSLVTAAKSYGFILVIVGHITKEGDIAGPKVLEHLVDTVLRFEGEREGHYRLLRVMKNRFGTTGEVGLLEMGAAGLSDVDPKLGIFEGDAEPMVGAVKTVVLEGNRPIIVQVQALTNHTVFQYPKRVSEGLSISRLQLICAILDRFAGTKLGDQDVYVRTAGGYSLQGPASDLAVAAAILSSVKGKPVPIEDLFVGELSLGGRVSVARNLASRLSSLNKFGIARVWTRGGAVSGRSVVGVEINGLNDLVKKLGQ